MTNNKVRQIIDHAKKENRELLTEVEAKQAFKEAGLTVTDTRLATDREEAVTISKQLGLPVALKIVSPDIIHKTDADGVKLNLKSPEEVAEAFEEIVASAKKLFPQAAIYGVSVQGMARPGTEVIIGMSHDAQFGPVLMFGLGGIFVEILKDVSFSIVPLTPKDAHDMIREIKSYPLFQGYRGQEKVDVPVLESWLLKLSDFVQQYPEIKEFDLNPIFAYSDGAAVVDARIILH